MVGLRIFLSVPLTLAILFGLVIASTAPSSMRIIFFGNVASAILVVVAAILISANWVAKKARFLKVLGILYGIVLLFIGALAFCIPNWFFFEDCTVRNCLLVPIGWICFYGWPVAAFCGLLFSGACDSER